MIEFLFVPLTSSLIQNSLMALVPLDLGWHVEHIKLTFVSEPLHFLLPLPGMQFPKMFLSLVALFTQILV